MKEDTKHRKRHKSESDSAKTEHTDAAHKSGNKAADKPHGGAQAAHDTHGHGTQQDARNRRISRPKMDHGPDHGHGHQDHHMEARNRRISRHRMDHGPDHGHDHQEHHMEVRNRRISRHRMDHGLDHDHHPEHGHGHAYRKISRDHSHYDDHYHGSHPIRPRRDTLSRYSHYESDRRSTGTVEASGPVVHYENTYKLTPDCKFHEGNVKNVIREVFKEHITETTYEPSMCGSKCKLLSEIIKERVKKLHIHRFKIISMVMIGQVFDQSMLMTSRCLWDHRFDNSVSVEYKKGDILAVGLVFAVYHE